MNTPELVQWQKMANNGLVQCWFTHNCLDWMEQQDWSDKNIIMFGAGLGDAWLAKKCKWLHVVERNDEWALKASTYAADNGVNNITYHIRKCNDCNGEQEKYVKLVDGIDFDIIINDDAYRNEVCQLAIDYFTEKGGGTLICDNWFQSFVWLSDAAVEMMAPYKSLIFEQSDHTDNDGVNKWKTAVFFI